MPIYLLIFQIAYAIGLLGSEKNILKLIKPLFLDELWNEFTSVKDSKAKLQKLHDKISKLRFLDPAFGYGKLFNKCL